MLKIVLRIKSLFVWRLQNLYDRGYTLRLLWYLWSEVSHESWPLQIIVDGFQSFSEAFIRNFGVQSYTGDNILVIKLFKRRVRFFCVIIDYLIYTIVPVYTCTTRLFGYLFYLQKARLIIYVCGNLKYTPHIVNLDFEYDYFNSDYSAKL